MGFLKKFKLQLHINKSITPVQQPIRRLPYRNKEKVSDELQRLQKLDIIQPAPGKTTWLNPVVPVIKPNGKMKNKQEEAFKTLKQKLTSAEIMWYYNPIAETNIVADAGPKGLVAILSQKQKNGQFKPISYSSRALTDVQNLYSETEKETLSANYYIYDICNCLHRS